MNLLLPSEVDFVDLSKRKYTLTVIIPCYNEVRTIRPVVERVLDGGLASEIIVAGVNGLKFLKRT